MALDQGEGRGRLGVGEHAPRQVAALGAALHEEPAIGDGVAVHRRAGVEDEDLGVFPGAVRRGEDGRAIGAEDEALGRVLLGVGLVPADEAHALGHGGERGDQGGDAAGRAAEDLDGGALGRLAEARALARLLAQRDLARGDAEEAAVEELAVGEDLEHRRRARRRGRPEHALPGVLEIARLDGHAVAPAGLGPQVKAVEPVVGAALEARGHALIGWVSPGCIEVRPSEELADERGARGVVGLAGVEVLGPRPRCWVERGHVLRGAGRGAEVRAGVVAAAARDQEGEGAGQGRCDGPDPARRRLESGGAASSLRITDARGSVTREIGRRAPPVTPIAAGALRLHVEGDAGAPRVLR